MSADDKILGIDSQGMIHKEAVVMDDNGKDFKLVKKVNPKHYDGIAMHPTMLSVEIFNKSGEIAYFESVLQEDVGMPHAKLAVKDQDFLFLPHLNYVAHTKSGKPVNAIVNLGKMKFRKNTQPSTMIAE